MIEAKIFHELCGQDVSNYYKYRASEASDERLQFMTISSIFLTKNRKSRFNR